MTRKEQRMAKLIKEQLFLKTIEGKVLNQVEKAKAIQWDGNAGKLTLTDLKKFLDEYDLQEKFEDSRYYDGKPTADDIFDFIQSKKEYKEKFAEKFGESMTRDELIEWIEENNLEDELRQRVIDKWEEYEDSIKSSRKKKYGTIPKTTDKVVME